MCSASRVTYLLIVALLSFCSCKRPQNRVDESKQSVSSGSNYSGSSSFYHTDDNYKYESRTGTSGNYSYEYDVEGTDQDGNDVTGNIDISSSDNYGTGTITDANGDEREVEAEWTGHGQMEATDEDGNTYELEAD